MDAGQPDGPVGPAGPGLDATAGHGVEAVRLLDLVPVAVASFDADLRLRHVNAAAERLLRRPRGALLARTIWDLLPDLAGTVLDVTYRSALASGEPVHLEQYYPPHDAWYEVDAVPVPTGLDVRFADITARRRARADAGAAVEEGAPGSDAGDHGPRESGVGLLAEVTAALGSTLDGVDAVRALARLVVPRLGDWCIVSLAADEHGGAVRDLAVAHAQPARERAVEEYARARASALAPGSPVLRALRGGEAVVLGDGGPASVERIAELLDDPTARDLLRDLAPGAAMALPLSARGRVNGVLTLYRDQGRTVWSDGDRRLAGEVAARAGMALDNARLYADRRHTSLVLQQAMLTPLPEVPWATTAARYVPGAVAEQVGGDWYDALVLPDGALAVAIGDVVGHDIAAAALMGQVRSTLRAFAWDHEEPPSRILTRLDQAMPGLRIDTVASAVLARVEVGAGAGTGSRVRWSTAGHPDPLLLTADGVVHVLDDGRDIVLGVTPGAVRHDHVRDLPPGSTLLLYTDGLVERRSHSVSEGQDALVAAVRRHARLPVADLLDAVVHDLVGPRRDDDTAAIAVRLTG